MITGFHSGFSPESEHHDRLMRQLCAAGDTQLFGLNKEKPGFYPSVSRVGLEAFCRKLGHL